MNERWAPVAGWEGFYEVSDQGRVRSIERTVNRGGRPMKVRAKMLRIHNSPPAFYSAVNLARNGERQSAYVHRMVLEAFVGPCPDGYETLHGNGVRADCRLGNLKWGTHLENIHDKWTHGTMSTVGKPKTHCPQGHPYDPSVVTPRGNQRCRTCARRWAKERRERTDTRCHSRILRPGDVTPIRCMGETGHRSDRITFEQIDHERCHWNTWRKSLWTDDAPDLIAAPAL